MSFRVWRHNLTWDSRGLCTTLVLISVSIINVITIALVLYANGSGLQLLTPGDEASSMPLGQPGGVTASYMVALVVKDTIELFGVHLIEPDIEGESEAWPGAPVGWHADPEWLRVHDRLSQMTRGL